MSGEEHATAKQRGIMRNARCLHGVWWRGFTFTCST